MWHKIGNQLFILAGFVSLILGVIGILIPMLPTTPFILLSSFCFVRGSSRLNEWLLSHKLFENYIHNYVKYKAIKKSAKIGAIVFLWISMGISILLIQKLSVSLILAAVGIAVSIHLLSLKTINEEHIRKQG